MKTCVGLSLILASILSLSAPASAAIKVLTCESEWAALVSELAGDKADVSSATTGRQDPHRIEARPSLIARVRNADLLVCTGLDLEAGWLPVLLQQSGNRRIQPGQMGHFLAGDFARRLETAGGFDRARGDVHTGGNPHLQMDPRNIARVARALSERLALLDATHADDYARAYAAFSERWQAAITQWEERAKPLRDIAVVTHHKDMVYLIDWLGMREVGNLEPKPGLEPSSAHLAQLLQQLQREPARLILRTPYQSERASEWLAAKARIKAVMLPNAIGGTDQADDLFHLFDDILSRLLGAL